MLWVSVKVSSERILVLLCRQVTVLLEAVCLGLMTIIIRLWSTDLEDTRHLHYLFSPPEKHRPSGPKFHCIERGDSYLARLLPLHQSFSGKLWKRSVT
jgi:hypothetical protein